MKIQITADRMIDLPKDELERLNIPTMSCFINMGGKSYEDSIDITPEDVFAHYAKTGELAKTAARSPETYYDFFKSFTDEGYAVVHFATSSGISALCENATKAAKMLPNTYVVDTMSLSNGIALLVRYALQLIENGETDPKKIYEECLGQREKLQDSFMIDTLEFLHKGGRCSSLIYYAANLFKIKPVVTLNKINGRMTIREKCRGSIRRAIQDYVANCFRKYPNPDLKSVYVVHFCKDEGLAQFFIDTVKSHHKFENVHFGIGTCNTTIHSGPNTVGLFYFVK